MHWLLPLHAPLATVGNMVLALLPESPAHLVRAHLARQPFEPRGRATVNIDIAIEALRWIAEHETDEGAIDQRAVCDNDAFHEQSQDGNSRCPVCFSRWWATDGSLPSAEGSYALGAVAAQALAALGEEEERPM